MANVTQGIIGYRNQHAELVGQEHFSLAYQSASVQLKAQCNMTEFNLHRSAFIAMNNRWQPEKGSVNISSKGKFKINSDFELSKHHIAICNELPGGIQQQQQLSNLNPVKFLGLHPLQGDALVTTQLPKIVRPDKYYSIPSVTNSVSENGDEGDCASLLNIEVAYLGIEPVKVNAGQFMARRYKLSWHPKWPPACLWTMVSEPVFLKMVWPQVPYWYELLEVEQSKFSF